MTQDNPHAARPIANGPLAGIHVVEFAGIGPGPFAGMLLADMGADVVRIARAGAPAPQAILNRGKSTVVLDLKTPEGVESAMKLLQAADALVEGFRPGVMERLGLGPDHVAMRNPQLVYGRMTGWGQSGPLSQSAGHDINYIAVTGALAAIGARNGAPVPPLNLVGDYGGGSLYLVVGLLAALLEAKRSGRGQVVDAAMCDGVLSLMSLACMQRARGQFNDIRGSNLLDGGRPYYSTYETADGKYLAVGALEPQFFDTLCKLVGVPEHLQTAQKDPEREEELRSCFAGLFRTKTRDEWATLLAGTDACVAPVLTLSEAREHPHLVARCSFIETAEGFQPAAAPRFSRTPSTAGGAAHECAVESVLERWCQHA